MQEWFQEEITDAKVLDLSIEVFKKKFKSLMGYQILFTIILAILIFLGTLVAMPMLFFLRVDGIFAFVLFMFFLIILIGSIIFVSEAGIFHITYSYLKGEDISVSDAVGRAFSSFLSILRVVTALAICLVPVLFALGAGGVTITAIANLQNNINSGSVYFILGYTLVISLVSAVVGSYLFYSLHIAIFEKNKGFASINRSIRLAKGEVFRNAFRVLSISIFQWAVNLSVYASIAAAAGLFSFLFGKVQGGESIVSQIILYGEMAKPFINFILGIILSPISSIIWTMYYVNMKYKKEGFKIHNLLNRLEKNQVNLEVHYE